MENIGKKEIRVNPRDLPWITCSKGNSIWETGYVMKRLSPLLSPTGKEERIPMEVIICRTCGKVPAFMSKEIPDLPKEIISDCE